MAKKTDKKEKMFFRARAHGESARRGQLLPSHGLILSILKYCADMLLKRARAFLLSRKFVLFASR
jgi:hypothetical protein